MLSYLAMRRRGLGAGLRGAAWSLLPLAAYLTGVDRDVLEDRASPSADFAKGFVFSAEVWAGIAVAGLAVVLFVVSGRCDAGASAARTRARTDRAVGAGAARRPPGAGDRAADGAGQPPRAPAQTPAKARKGKNAADDDDDLGDVEDILRRHGIT